MITDLHILKRKGADLNMTTGKIVAALPTFTDRHRRLIAEAAQAHGYTVAFYPDTQSAVADVGDAEIILSYNPDPAKQAPKLKWFCTSSAGVDPFLKEGVFASPDAVLTNSSGAYGVTIAEHIVMVTLEIMRRQQEYTDIVSRREWIRNLPIRAIHGSRVTLLGTGDIGQEAVQRLRAFRPAELVGVNRRGANPRGLFDRVLTQDRLDEVLPKTDLLIISLPGTAETRHMVDARRLAMMPDGAILVNVGRGHVVDTRALETELRAGRLHAALDVFEQEPLPQDDPLWTCPNLLITPHIAGNMTLPYTVDRIVSMFLEDFENYCAGRPLKHLVERKRGY